MENFIRVASVGDIQDGGMVSAEIEDDKVIIAHLDGEISTTHGLDTGMQNALLCYVKARLFEDQGDIQKAQYFRQMYEKMMKQYPSRRSGVRSLSVPRL